MTDNERIQEIGLFLLTAFAALMLVVSGSPGGP